MKYSAKYIISIFGLTLGLCYANAQSSVDTKIAVSSQTDEKTFVVIIANENYKHEEAVPFARNDGVQVLSVHCISLFTALATAASNVPFSISASDCEVNVFVVS